MAFNNHDWVKSLYVPKDCLQGTEFPGHIIWDRRVRTKIKVFLPEGIKVSEMYNVKDDGFTLDNNVLDIFGFEVNGYVGFVFKSMKFKEYGVTKKLKFLIESEVGALEEEREIYLFRPEVVVEHKPDSIEIEVRDNNEIEVSERIRVVNKGEGTAILNINIPKGSKIVKKRPEDFEEFVTNFWNDLDSKFTSLKEDYPEYGDILDRFIEIGKKPVEFTKEYLSELEDLFKKLITAFEDNEDFMYDFVNAIVTAYVMNLHIITELNSFLEFLKSIASKKILLYDPMAVFEIPKSVENLVVTITMTDLANNEYPPIDISVKLRIKSTKDEPIRIPLYDLFEFS